MAGLLVLVVLVLLPLPALAFGPITHVELGLDVLARAADLGAMGALAASHPRCFLQGTLGPDRELAKNLASYEKHSHNWSRFFKLFTEASQDRHRAFFLGCLCHLAADVVSHHYFVPLKMVESHRARFAAHLYWEMRLDARAGRRGRARAMRLLDVDGQTQRRFLATVVPGNLLGARFNVRMTDLAMRVQRANAFQDLSEYIDRESRLSLADRDVAEIRSMAVDAQVSVFRRMERAPVVSADARGLGPLSMATQIRGQLRDEVRRHGDPNPRAAALVADSRAFFHDRVQGALFR